MAELAGLAAYREHFVKLLILGTPRDSYLLQSRLIFKSLSWDVGRTDGGYPLRDIPWGNLVTFRLRQVWLCHYGPVPTIMRIRSITVICPSGE